MSRPARQARAIPSSLRGAVNNAPMMLFEIDRAGKVTLLEGGLAQKLGLNPQQAVGRSVLDMHAGNARALALIKRALAGEAFCETIRVAGRRLEMSFAPRRGKGGRSLGFTGWAVDVTDRQKTEAALALSEHKFYAAFQSSPYPQAITDMKTGRLVEVNEAFKSWTGFSGEDIAGRTTKELGIWQNPDQRDEMVSLALTRGAFRDLPARLRLKSGEVRDVLFSCALFKTGGNSYLFTAAVDITDSLRDQEEVKLSFSQLQATLESTTDAILVVDRDGRMTSWNQRFLQFWSIPEDVAASRDDGRALRFVLELLKEPERFLAKVRDLYAHPEAESFDTLEFKDGRIIERYSQPQRLVGKVVGRVWSFRDVTERKRAEAERARLLRCEQEARAEAEAASRAKDDFLAIVSHELRTPLTAILGWSWLLRHGELSDRERDEALEIITRNMQMQRQLVEDILDISSSSRGQLAVERAAIELGTVLNAACDSLLHVAQDRSIRLIRDIPEGAGVMGDAGRLQQVFWNLLNNSLKFTPDGGEIRVRLRREGAWASAEIADNGRGIPRDFLAHVFEPFRQGEAPLTREHRGLGLGLAIVKKIVELHDGRVAARSEGRDRGAAFTVSLPAIAWPPPGRSASPGREARTELAGLEGLHILLVEDEADTRQLLAELLSRCGSRVETAASAAQAMACLEKSAFDLLVCDIAMPGEDGCSLMKRLRERGGRFGAVPAVALTALARDEDRVRAISSGFQKYLVKPVEPAALVEALRSMVLRR